LAYRAGETGLEETGTSVEDYGGRLASWHWRRGGVDNDTDGCFRHVGSVCLCKEEEEEYKERRKGEDRSVPWYAQNVGICMLLRCRSLPGPKMWGHSWRPRKRKTTSLAKRCRQGLGELTVTLTLNRH
jgi:hypothetical protein